MKLISMTAFVIEKTNKITNEWSEDDQIRLLDEISNYANFLNQPLTLGMFVCEVPEPEMQGGYSPDGDFVGGYCEEWIESYQQAKDKVLFDGFGIEKEKFSNLFYDVVRNHDTYVFFNDNGNFKKVNDYDTIEGLVLYNLPLTPNAIKQFNL